MGGVLIASVSFGVYKNFTAIDMHTVHETETIQLRLNDTSGIENFVKNFAKSYYSWNNSKEAIEARTQAISGYLAKELQDLNFFLGMSDTEIGDKMKINRSTSFRIRKSSLDKIGKKLKENTKNE